MFAKPDTDRHKPTHFIVPDHRLINALHQKLRENIEYPFQNPTFYEVGITCR